jgi:P4 family phage/plasmid primase-like protien
MSDPRPEEFRRFAELLLENAPDEYQPWFFRCESSSKAPDITFGSWKEEQARLGVDQAVQWMQQGGNVGIAGRPDDRLINVDIDDEDETSPDDLKSTLVARSRSRTGAHAWYFESDHTDNIPNIPTDNKGEVRTDWQYVVAPGSYVPVDDKRNLPPEEQADAGYYTVEREQPVSSLRYEELPEVFKQANRSTGEVELAGNGVAASSETVGDVDVGSEVSTSDSEHKSSALFDIEATDVVRKEVGSTNPGDRWSGIFHDSTTGENMAVSDEGLLHCWRHSVAHNGLQALATLSEYTGTCEDVGSPHRQSNAGSSCFNNEEGAHIWHAWKYAKRNRYIPDDDPVPYSALKHLCQTRDLCPVTDLPNSADESIPSYAYDGAIKSIRGHDGLNPGRKTTDEIVDDDTSDSYTTADDTESGSPDDDSTELTWSDIRKGYHTASQSDDRLAPRYDARQLLKDEDHWRNVEETDHLWVYEHDTGLFVPRGEQLVRNRLVQNLNEQFRSHEANEICTGIKGEPEHQIGEDELGGPPERIACDNGVLKLDTHPPELVDHHPRFGFISTLETEFDPAAECPRFEQFIEETIPEPSDQLKLQEFAGYVLMHWALPYHKAMFLVGPTASGKSTFLDTIRAMIGDSAGCSLTPQQMTEEQFSAAELYESWVNIRNDIPAQTIQNTGQFKEIIAGDPIKAEEKYQDPFMFSPDTKHMFSGNELPEADESDNSDAFYRRIMLVAFPETIPRSERESDLDQQLQSELPGVLNWALEGLKRLRDSDGFTGDRPPGQTEITWQKWSNSIKRFVEEGLEEAGGNDIAKSEVHGAYQNYCESEGIPARSQHKFSRWINTHTAFEDGRAHIGGSSREHRKRVFKHCQLTEIGREYLERDGST